MRDMWFQNRVAAGAALLDKEEPGWAERVDVDQLNLRNVCACVLGQLHRDYTDGLVQHGLSYDQARELGFDLPEQGFEDVDEAWRRLTSEWKRQIAARREEPAA